MSLKERAALSRTLSNIRFSVSQCGAIGMKCTQDDLPRERKKQKKEDTHTDTRDICIRLVAYSTPSKAMALGPILRWRKQVPFNYAQSTLQLITSLLFVHLFLLLLLMFVCLHFFFVLLCFSSQFHVVSRV